MTDWPDVLLIKYNISEWKTKTDFCGLVMMLVLSVCLFDPSGSFPANRIKPAVSLILYTV